MKLSSIFLYGLLLLVPTIVLGVFGWNLLRQEESRLEEAAVAAKTERARIVAENLALFLEEAHGGIIASLSEMPPDDARDALDTWTNANPLVRQSFIWRPYAGVILPLGGPTDTHSHFQRRYNDLLAPRNHWEESPRERSFDDTAPERRGRTDERQESAAIDLTPRQELKQIADDARIVNLARQSYTRSQADFSDSLAPEPTAPRIGLEASTSLFEAEAAEMPRVVSFGWIPFLDETELSAIAWVELQPGGEVRGAEVDLEAVITRMLAVLPREGSSGESYHLLDHAGNFFPPAEVRHLASDAPRLDLGPLLPQWQLLISSPPGSNSAGHGFFLLSSLLLGVLLISILSGGSLLLLQAHHHQMDARQKSGFVSNVSHELKTPLTTIRMYAELIGENRVPDEARRRDYLNVIISESQRLTRLINNVLDFSRLEQGSEKPRPQTIDLPSRLTEILDAHELRLTAAGIQLIREFPDTRVPASVDADSLEQAVLNLIDNALKYAADGGELRVVIEREETHSRIHFLDKGPGIPANQERRLFEEFSRGDTSLTANHPGCGLGLNIARRLLQRTHGNLFYRTRQEGGACFTIELPSRAPNEHPA